MHDVEQLTETFRARGRKVTAQRQCIFKVLEGDVTHPSAETVFEAARREMSTISLKTVYQTLHELVEMGEIASLDVGTGTVRFDPNVDAAHHHLVCRSCGSVRDHDVSIVGLDHVPSDVQGYEVHQAEVVFRGLCPECRSAGRTDKDQPTRVTVTIEAEREMKGTKCQI
ncbi:MAG: Fur family transcriptional regulator [Acidimicrobiales bacterium]